MYEEQLKGLAPPPAIHILFKKPKDQPEATRSHVSCAATQKALNCTTCFMCVFVGALDVFVDSVPYLL